MGLKKINDRTTKQRRNNAMTTGGLPGRDRSKIDASTALATTKFWLVERKIFKGCHLWQGQITDRGYGRFMWEAEPWPAHELAVTFSTGVVKPDGMETLHSCDVRACVNPEHLRFGTHAENMAEASTRQRFDSLKASNNGWRRLTVSQVVEIRELRKAGSTTVSLAETYGVNPAQITKIAAGRSWKWAPGPITEPRKQRNN